MIKVIATILLVSLRSICFAQTDIKATLDTVIQRAKQTSMYTARVNWDSLQQQVYRKAENARTIKDLAPAFTVLLNGLMDKHAKIVDAKNYSTLAYFTDYAKLNHPDKRTRDNKIWEQVNDTALHFDYKKLPNNIGYLKIVGIAPNVDIEAESKKIRNAVLQLAAAKVDKWIIDLRYNGGGNMHPMMTGIGTLVGDGKVGSLANLAGEKLFEWEIKSGNFIYAGAQPVTLANKPVFKKQPKIAVLTSMYTVSSGEVVAACLKGRPHTRFFGEATGSYTTNNNWEIINNQVILNISTGIFSDRNGNIYEYNIPVDEAIPFEVIKDTGKDSGIIAATKWLLKK
jgi:carboxyl-terminal processing protease